MKSFFANLWPAGLLAIVTTLATVSNSAWAQPSFTVTPSSVPFGDRAVGTFSIGRQITVTNTGSTSLIITSFDISPHEFQLMSGVAQTLAPGQHALYIFRFAPDAAQTFSGLFTVNVDGAAPVSVPLTGTGTISGASASLSQTNLAFGNQAAGTTSSPQTVTLTNVGKNKLTVDSITVDPPFELGGFTPPVVLTGGSSLSFQISLFGTAAAPYANSATLNYDVLPPSGVSLSGTVTPPVTLGITTMPSLSSATVQSPYVANLTAVGGVPPYNWTLGAGSVLPTGLTLSSQGEISGTLDPSVTIGNYPFSIQVQDSSIPPNAVSESVTLPVAALTGGVCSNITSYVAHTNTPLVPINDLGPGTYLGKVGGLYGDGSNVRPAKHNSDGIAIAQSIQPLDANGNPDPNGKYALMSVGASPAYDTWFQFVPNAAADPSISPYLVLVSGAQPGEFASDLANPNNPFWTTMIQISIPQAGVTPNQIVAVWFHDIDRHPSGTFPGDMTGMQSEYETIAQNLHTKFPNLKLMYLNSSIYTGYSPSNCPEPYAYETAFAVKWAIADQISGLPSLNYDPTKGPVMAPWMAWASYDWANGLNARSDGLTWACPDITADGCHPSMASGREKEADLLLNFFKSDATTIPWFLARNTGGSERKSPERQTQGTAASSRCPRCPENRY